MVSFLFNKFYARLIKPILFLKDPEEAHYFTFSLIKKVNSTALGKALLSGLFNYQHPNLHTTVFGLRFNNPIGLAAGFDKNAYLLDAWPALGFGFIEIGTVTPLPQEGNAKPRLFRLPKDSALINRMGFNNDGATVVGHRLKNKPRGLIVGGNIGKNKDTPNDKALEDYLKCYFALAPYVDYIAINISSPNTPGLRALQDKEPLKVLLQGLKDANLQQERVLPLLLKIAPDLTNSQLDDIIEIVTQVGLDGIIATNTTIARDNLNTPVKMVEAIGLGGLSGAPLHQKSTEVLAYLRVHLPKAFPIIAAGGISGPEDALAALQAGASLIQIYSGYVYKGPTLVPTINQFIAKHWVGIP